MAQWQPSGFVKLMGIKIIRRSVERSEAEVLVREELCNWRGVMHGGAVMGWADTIVPKRRAATLSRKGARKGRGYEACGARVDSTHRNRL
jgi:hypothetical protein